MAQLEMSSGPGQPNPAQAHIWAGPGQALFEFFV